LSDEEWEAFLSLLDRPTIEAWLVSLSKEKK
jgi:aryl carrier-like protein